MRIADDRRTTIPLILGFFIIALITVAGAVAAGDAFVQQRGLQDVCDGAAAAAAAGGADLNRGTALA
ncbi:MAG: pilus assembly protein TadG-related protein, partial [Actinomycetota bacterium]|nr:pilus assembly protein TadG-related protein [Actinomycetota bacterium]